MHIKEQTFKHELNEALPAPAPCTQVVTDYTSVNTENSSVCVYVRARPPDPSWTLEDDDASVEEDKFQNPLQATLAGAFIRVEGEGTQSTHLERHPLSASRPGKCVCQSGEGTEGWWEYLFTPSERPSRYGDRLLENRVGSFLQYKLMSYWPRRMTAGMGVLLLIGQSVWCTFECSAPIPSHEIFWSFRVLLVLDKKYLRRSIILSATCILVTVKLRCFGDSCVTRTYLLASTKFYSWKQGRIVFAVPTQLQLFVAY